MIEFAVGRDRMEVDLDDRHVACPAHAAPFRARWPLGWAEWSMAVAQAALDSPMLQTGVHDPAYWRDRHLYWGDLPTAVGPARVRAMLEDRPACEWVEPRQLFGLYRASGIGVLDACSSCRRVALGTEFPVRIGQGYMAIPHLCFGCIVRRRVA